MNKLKFLARLSAIFLITVFVFTVIGPVIGYSFVMLFSKISLSKLINAMWMGYYAGIIPAFVAGIINSVLLIGISLAKPEIDIPASWLSWGIGAIAGFLSSCLILIFILSSIHPAIFLFSLLGAIAGSICGKIINRWTWPYIFI